MGRVWAARDELLARDVAIKELTPPPGLTEPELVALRERAIREARSIAMLDQPNVVRIFDVVFHGGDPWIVMELVPSRSLFDTVRDDGPMAPDQVARVGLGVLAALRAAHRVGLLHRDVKPGNVLLAHDGRVVLTDFGLATVAGDVSITRTGVVLGSPQYLAPERALDGEVGPAADLWSLGATLYAAVEGRPPYVRSSPMTTLAALATELPDPPERAGVLRVALTALLQRDPARRADAETAHRLLLAATAPGSPPPADVPVYGDPTFATTKPKTATPAPVAAVAAGKPSEPSESLTTESASKKAEKRRAPVAVGVAVAALLIAVGAITYPLVSKPETPSPQALPSASLPGQAAGAGTPLPGKPSKAVRPRRSPSPGAPSASATAAGTVKGGKKPSAGASTAATGTTTPTTEAAATGTPFESNGTGTCLYAPASTGQIQSWACNGSAGQRFTIGSDKTLRVRGKCVQIGSTDDGATLRLATCTGAPAQQWDYNSSFDLVNLWAIKCVDIPDASSSNGVVVQIWECTGASHQKWSHA
nr:hypothetical protein Ade03nite_70610 [Actinoplanes derwentensis]